MKPGTGRAPTSAGGAARLRSRLHSAGRGVATLSLAVGLGLVLGLGSTGCDAGTTSREEPAAKAAKTKTPGETKPPLPDAPWFELPADWDEQHPTLSPNARPDLHWMALAERERPPAAADSAGRIRLESVGPPRPVDAGPGVEEDGRGGRRGRASGERPRLVVGSRQRFELVFEVGKPGIVEGGRLFVLPDPFWEWSPAQSRDPAGDGYTTAVLRAKPAAGATAARSGAPDASARLVPTELPGAFRVEGRALAAGEEIAIVYGAGAAGARVDRHAERGSELRIGLDADGDGRRAWLPEPVKVDIVAKPGEILIAFADADVAPGARLELNLAIVDFDGNRARWPEASLDQRGASRARFRVDSLPGATLEPRVGLGEQSSLADADGPHRLVVEAPAAEGVLRLRVRGVGALDGIGADLPPIVVRRSPTRLVWGDLHGHTRYSDGTGDPEDYFRYARDVARVDVLALTDHDHWGLTPLDESPARQAEILALAKRFHAPGRFVTLPGYEWTSWLHGHRHVLSFDDALTLRSSLDPATDRPDELWAALRGLPVLTFAHHSAGAPIATDWHFEPDPVLEPVTEIASVHGSSEAADAPAPIGEAIAGNFVRDVLRHGARLGFIGSGDSHDGHPGLAELAGGQGGLAGLFTTALERGPLLEALRARRTFATNGIRPWLEVSIDGVGMGGTLAARDEQAEREGHAKSVLRIRYEATAPIERVELIRSGHVAKVELPAIAPATPDAAQADAPAPPRLSLDLERRIPSLEAGEFHYVRIVQSDGGVAWSSPIFVDARTERSPE